MVPRFLGLPQFERNCKMPDPQNLVHLSRGLLVKISNLNLISFLQIDLSKHKCMPSVKYQGPCGSCWVRKPLEMGVETLLK